MPHYNALMEAVAGQRLDNVFQQSVADLPREARPDVKRFSFENPGPITLPTDTGSARS